jgi:hypothetical protein
LRSNDKDVTTTCHGRSDKIIGTPRSYSTAPTVETAIPIEMSSMKTRASTAFAPIASDDETPEEILYRQRKEQWAAKYTSVDALRKTFGTNRNGIWGDLDPQTTRRLYKTLLPRALLELHCTAVNSCAGTSISLNTVSTTKSDTVSPASSMDDSSTHDQEQSPLLLLHPEDLAPLAYQARVAAKLYARERCVLPARIAANLIDGFRQWKKYGQFHCHGMSYQQLWDKYASVILHDVHKNQYDLTVEDVTAKICLKILERSCQTNPAVDQLVNCPQEDYCTSVSVSDGIGASPTELLTTTTNDSNKDYNTKYDAYGRTDDDDVVEDLKLITAQLEADARNLLRPIDHARDENDFMFTEGRHMAVKSLQKLSRNKFKKGTILVPATLTSKQNIAKDYRRTYTTSKAASSNANTNDFQQHKVRLLRSMLRLKRKFERFQCRQIQEQRDQQHGQDQHNIDDLTASPYK